MKYFLYSFIVLALSCQQQNNSDTASSADNLDNVIDETTPDESETADTSAPMDFGLRTIDGTAIPDLDYSGNLTDCWNWDDKNGANYLIRSIDEPEFKYPEDDGDEIYDQYLHVYHYVIDDNGEVRLLRDLTDFIKDCMFDLIMNHIDAVMLSDIDNDNYGEIAFGYRLACTSDVSPSEQKVLLFENGDKYILRGEAVAIGYGGDYEPGNEFDTAPEGFLAQAEKYWEANKVEFELEDNEF
jgi:hypothetical protein